MSKDNLLAVAFTDLNGNDKYNPGKDTLIAALVDTNNDNTASTGDTVVWGLYPAIPDGSESGTGGKYTSLVTTVTDAFLFDFGVKVDTALGSVTWVSSPNEEQFATFDSDGIVESLLVDTINQAPFASDDTILADTTVIGAGLPSDPAGVSNHQLGDQAFLDVLLHL
jgi:hypothetical protein